MGSTGTPSRFGSDIGEALGVTSGRLYLVPMAFTMSASYATGGDTLTLPSSDIEGLTLLQVGIDTPHNGTYLFAWDGNRTTPKIKAFSAFATEVTATTDLSAVTLRCILYYISGR